jgi:hypothetical protein
MPVIVLPPNRSLDELEHTLDALRPTPPELLDQEEPDVTGE